MKKQQLFKNDICLFILFICFSLSLKASSSYPNVVKANVHGVSAASIKVKPAFTSGDKDSLSVYKKWKSNFKKILEEGRPETLRITVDSLLADSELKERLSVPLEVGVLLIDDDKLSLAAQVIDFAYREAKIQQHVRYQQEALMYLSEIKELTVDYETAISTLHDALKLDDHSRTAADIYSKLGVLNAMTENYDFAKKMFESGLQVCEEHNDLACTVKIRNNLAMNYIQQKKFSEAVIIFGLNRKEIKKDTTLKRYLMGITHNEALIYEKQKNYKLAIKKLDEALNLFEPGKLEVRGRVFTLISKAKILSKYGNTSEAIKILKEVETYSIVEEDKIIALRLYRELAALYFEQEKYKDAYLTHAKYNSINFELLNRDKDKNIADLNVRYETAKKENELELFKEKADAQARELLNHRRLLILGAMLVGSILVFAGLLFGQRQKLKKINKELDLANQNLSGMNDSLSLANAQRTEFIDFLAHDLKAPFSNIQLYVQLHDKQLDDFDAAFKDMLFKEIWRGKKLIDDFLNIRLIDAKNENRKVAYHRFNANELIERQLVSHGVHMKSKGIRVHKKFVEDSCSYIYSNAVLLDRIIDNVLSNAIKFSPNDAVITVATTQEKERLLMTIEDNAGGIKLKQDHMIVETSSKELLQELILKNPQSVGMTIIKNLSEKLGADLRINNMPSKGLKIDIVLPLAKEEKIKSDYVIA